MTRKRRDSPSASSRTVDDIQPGENVLTKPRSNFSTASIQSDASSASFAQSSYDIYQFGQLNEYGDAMPHRFPPPLFPALNFTGDPQPNEEEHEPPDLFSTFVAAELYTPNADGFARSYPYAFFENFEELDRNNNFPPIADVMNSSFILPQQPPQFHATNHPNNRPNHFLPIEPSGQPLLASQIGNLPHRPKERKGARGRVPYPTLYPKDRSDTGQAPPDAFDIPDATSGNKKRRALSPDGRENARQVRLRGACARCSKLRTRCDAQRPCTTCRQNQKRKFDFPCMEEFPEDRWPHFFTEIMYGHLDNAQMFTSMPQPTEKRGFTLTLWQYFDDPPLEIQVREFEPRAEQDLTKSTFPVIQKGDKFEVHEAEILSPPLVPEINKQTLPGYCKYFYRAVHRWLECARVHDDLQWHETFFRPEHGKPWPRMVLGHICRFYHDVTRGGETILRTALCTTVLMYMLNHSFYIPPHDVPDVLGKMDFGAKYEKEPTFFVSPAYVDRFVKILLFPVYRASVKASLAGFQKLYSPARPSRFTRDRLMAISIVLLIVAACQQGKAIEKALAQHRKGNPIDPNAVYDHVLEIEKYIVDLVLELWKYKFSGNVKFSEEISDDRIRAIAAKDFDITNKFRTSYTEFADSLNDLPTEVPHNLDPQNFCAENVERVLKKFYLCVFPPK